MTELTAHETEVLRELADGSGYKEVAYRLGLSFHTIKSTAQRAYRKLGVSTLVGAYRALGWLRV